METALQRDLSRLSRTLGRGAAQASRGQHKPAQGQAHPLAQLRYRWMQIASICQKVRDGQAVKEAAPDSKAKEVTITGLRRA